MDPTAVYQSAASTREPHAAQTPACTSADQVVVGDIPAQRPGFQPRPVLLTQLNRVSQRQPVVVLTGTGEWARPTWLLRMRGRGWRAAGGSSRGSTPGAARAC